VAALVLDGLYLALLALRRWRHLLVWWVSVQAGAFLVAGQAVAARRPRPIGVELQASWGGWALPSVQVAFLTVILMECCTRWCRRAAGATPASGSRPR
jgi:hypothetical protein